MSSLLNRSAVCSTVHVRSSKSQIKVSRPCTPLIQQKQKQQRRCHHIVRAEAEVQGETELAASDSDKKKAEADRLRAAEKFLVVGTGEAECKGCGYLYEPKKGDSEYPIPPGTQFQDLPGDWQCPVCGAEKNQFSSKAKTIAGFAENQKYGFGTNSMTEAQKSGLIWGSLALFFSFFIAGYFLQ